MLSIPLVIVAEAPFWAVRENLIKKPCPTSLSWDQFSLLDVLVGLPLAKYNDCIISERGMKWYFFATFRLHIAFVSPSALCETIIVNSAYRYTCLAYIYNVIMWHANHYSPCWSSYSTVSKRHKVTLEPVEALALQKVVTVKELWQKEQDQRSQVHSTLSSIAVLHFSHLV